MLMIDKVLSIIPARGGSKGIHRKNVANLGGRPLIEWTISASLASEYIDSTVVSSDDDEILSLSELAGAEALKRPASLAADDTLTYPVVEHVIRMLETKGRIYEVGCLLQPTSPLRTAMHINAAFAHFIQAGAQSLISVTETDNKILKAFKLEEDGSINALSDPSFPFMRRQDLPRTFLSNGAIYIFEIREFLAKRSFLLNKAVPYIMNEQDSLDIDSVNDLARANQLVSVL